jgi:hypothetical protein
MSYTLLATATSTSTVHWLAPNTLASEGYHLPVAATPRTASAITSEEATANRNVNVCHSYYV